MTIPFGEQKILYRVYEKQDEIEIHVYHSNKAWLKKIQQHSANPRYFLRLADDHSENPRAKYWLGKIVRAYLSYFDQNKVTFRL